MNTWMKVAGIGMLAGMRTMAALTAASFYTRQAETRRPDKTGLHWLGSQWAGRLLPVLAVGEMVFDKLPAMPDRIAPPSLAGRALTGALAGATVAAADGKHPGLGAAGGAAAAVASSYASFYLRQKASQNLNTPDPLLGTIEDGVVALTGGALSQS